MHKLHTLHLAALLLVACGAQPDEEEPQAISEDSLTVSSDNLMPLTLTSPSGCLDGASTAFLGFLVPAPCNANSSTQHWRVHPTGEIENANLAQCLVWEPRQFRRLTIWGAGLADCNTSGARAIWQATPAGEFRQGSNCLTAQSNSVTLDPCNRSAAQNWMPAFAPDGSQFARFGYGNMRRANGHFTQHVPLVRVYVNYTLSPTPLAHTVAYYEDLIFGSGFPRLNAYLADASSGIFQYADAGHFGPFNVATNGAGCDSGPVLENIIRTNLAGSLDLASFDTDRSGTVDHGELQFMVIGNCGGHIAGATRWVNCINNLDSGPGALNACPGLVSEIEDQPQFATLAHESLHPLGTIDLYGWGNYQTSVMAATIEGWKGADATSSYMLDAWHRFQLGWNRPFIQETIVGQPLQGSLFVDLDRNFYSSLIVGTPSKYYFLERRQPIGYNADAADDGVAIWQIESSPFRVTTRDPVSGGLGNGPNLHFGVWSGLPIAADHSALVHTEWTLWGTLLSWRWDMPMFLSVVENSHTSTTKNITITALDGAGQPVPLPGSITLNGNLVGTTGQPFDYPIALELMCGPFGCTVGTRLQTFKIVAAGFAPNTVSWR